VPFAIVCEIEIFGGAKGLNFPHHLKLPKAITLPLACPSGVFRLDFTLIIDFKVEGRPSKGRLHRKDL
jgi:hypothetical protein